jgi:hypothetical protein
MARIFFFTSFSVSNGRKIPATAHCAYFSMQRALYDKGSAQGKQPEKRAKRFAAAGGAPRAVPPF